MSPLVTLLRANPKRWNKSWQYAAQLETGEEDGLARRVLETLLHAAPPESYLQRLIAEQQWDQVDSALNHPAFAEIKPRYHSKLQQHKRAQQHRILFDQEVQKASAWLPQTLAKAKAGLPLFPYHDRSERLLRWLVQENAEQEAPKGFLPRWALQPDDVVGRKLVQVLQAILSEQSLESHALTLAECLQAVLQPGFRTRPPTVELNPGFLRVFLRGFTLREMHAQTAHAAGAGSWLYLPTRDEIEWPELPADALYFNPLELSIPKPHARMELRLITIIASLHNTTLRAEWIRRELARQMPLREALSSDWIAEKGGAQVSDEDRARLGQEIFSVAERFGVTLGADDAAPPLPRLLFLTGAIPRLSYTLLQCIFESLSEQKGRRYGPVTGNDVERAWRDRVYQQEENAWLEGLGSARDVLNVMVEDAQTQSLTSGFPVLSSNDIHKNLPSWGNEAINAALQRLREYGLIDEVPNPSGQRWQLWSSGIVWRRVIREL